MVDVTPDSNAVVSLLATAVGGAVAGFFSGRKGSKEGAKEGAAGALNGTAVAVRETKILVEQALGTIGSLSGILDGHVVQTAENFRSLTDNVHNIAERTSNIEGRLAIPATARRAAPKAAMKAKRKPAPRKRT